MPMAPTFNAARLRADLRARGLTPTDLVKLLVAADDPDGAYTFREQEYMRCWQRVHRFLGGKSSIETAARIAQVMGYATSRYVSLAPPMRKALLR